MDLFIGNLSFEVANLVFEGGDFFVFELDLGFVFGDSGGCLVHDFVQFELHFGVFESVEFVFLIAFLAFSFKFLCS